MKMICPKCGGNEFITTAHVMQDWKVNASGNYLETINGCVQVDRNPDPDNIWTCCRCGSVAIDEKNFIYDKNNFTIYCESDQPLFINRRKVGQQCYLNISKQPDHITYIVYDKDRNKLYLDCLATKRTAETAPTLLDDLKDLLDTLFGMQGYKMVINPNKLHWFKLVDLLPDSSGQLVKLSYLQNQLQDKSLEEFKQKMEKPNPLLKVEFNLPSVSTTK